MAPAADLMSDDLYDVLAVARNASASEINKAYRRLAQKHHPDKNLSRKQAAEEEFKRIAAAYEVLSCPEKRKQYDQFGKAVMERSSKHGPEDLEERQEAARAVAAAKKAVAATRAAAAAQVAQQRKQSRLAKEKEEQLRKKEKKAKKLVGASMAPALLLVRVPVPCTGCTCIERLARPKLMSSVGPARLLQVCCSTDHLFDGSKAALKYTTVMFCCGPSARVSKHTTFAAYFGSHW